MLQICAGAFGLAAAIGMAGAQEVRGPVVAGSAPVFMQLAQASPGVEPAPIAPLPGQLNLNDEQRQQILQSVEQAHPQSQPVPRAFAPAVGMTSPPELKLDPMPEPARAVPGVNKDHHFALLDNGMVMVVGENRLVVALISPGANGTTGKASSPPSR
jgi:hypothetical protein